MKSGKDGKTFGTVSTKQLASKLEELGYKIDKKNIILDNPINSLGAHSVSINLHKTVIAKVTINISEK